MQALSHDSAFKDSSEERKIFELGLQVSLALAWLMAANPDEP